MQSQRRDPNASLMSGMLREGTPKSVSDLTWKHCALEYAMACATGARNRNAKPLHPRRRRGAENMRAVTTTRDCDGRTGGRRCGVFQILRAIYRLSGRV